MLLLLLFVETLLWLLFRELPLVLVVFVVLPLIVLPLDWRRGLLGSIGLMFVEVEAFEERVEAGGGVVALLVLPLQRNISW